ncbi:MlaA family lipoprotein [Vibrio algarum]|uniref:MlaA family lipoprotein n=1 Tax=Vibrio algarum TaxID=3020714 RepID=A0ABT4YPL1_9VIBR|nr:MlaA family lipoprotein [Vibrio sp. KJ40-1]MDB1123332.1 MlaA family lipoprotein [Vibrio sp. KJ40-1]
MFIARLKGVLVVFFTILLLGCSSTPEQAALDTEVDQQVLANEPHPNDPIEGFNRAMWSFNYDFVDPYLFRPIAVAYVEYTPTPIRTGISNFLSNLDEPSSMINDLIMGNGKEAVNHFNRFWINSTFGILGLFDIAGAAGIVEDDRAFSDAIGHYGVGNGPYLMVPAYGPLTTRELTDTVDSMYLPLSYLNFWGAVGKWALEGLESRAALVSQEQMLEASPDPYAFTRDVYLQRRDYKAQIEPEELDEEEEDFLDDYLDEEF